MTICARNPFDCRGGGHLLVGGYNYWPLWFYGQRNELPDVSGHGVTLYPSGAYFDGQGYYFDGSDDYLIDTGGRKVLDENTKGSWHSVYLTKGAVPAKGSIWGTGTLLGLNSAGVSPKITGKIVLRHEYCPNLTHLRCYKNDISILDVSAVTSLIYLAVYINNISVLDISTLTLLEILDCSYNNISVLDFSTLTKIRMVWVSYNSMNQAMVDTVLCDINSHGTSNGLLRIQRNAAPSAAGIACRDELISRGWDVTTD